MITSQNTIHNKIRSLSLRIFNYLENNGDTNFQTNGEEFFVDNLFAYLKKRYQDEITLFDIGANIGDYTQVLLDKSSSFQNKLKIHVFEPTQSCYEVLKKKFSGVEEVVLNQMAVSNCNGTAKIFSNEQKSGLASLYKRNLDAYSIKMNQSEVVNTLRLEDYIDRKHINHIHLLKVDVEGHEMAAFEGLGSYLEENFIDFVQFEYGGANLDSHTSLMGFFSLFEKAGFKLAKVMPNGLNIRRYQPWMDNFQYANYVAISKNVVGKL